MTNATAQTLNRHTDEPLKFDMRTSTFWTAIRLLVLAAALFVIAMPLSLIVSTLIADPDALATAMSEPQAAIQAALGMAFWIVLWGWPAKRCIDDLWRRRAITMDRHQTVITDHNIFWTTQKTQPTRDFLGLVRHLRTSPSGTCHDVILLHSNPAKNIRLLSGDAISVDDATTIANQLGLPLLPASHLYRIPCWRTLLPGARSQNGPSAPARA